MRALSIAAATSGAAPGGTSRSPWPDAWLIFADRGVVLDHATGDVWAVWLEDVADRHHLLLRRPAGEGQAAPAIPIQQQLKGLFGR